MERGKTAVLAPLVAEGTFLDAVKVRKAAEGKRSGYGRPAGRGIRPNVVLGQPAEAAGPEKPDPHPKITYGAAVALRYKYSVGGSEPSPESGKQWKVL